MSGLLISCKVGCDVRCLRLSTSNMGLYSFGCCSGVSSLLLWSDCIYICSYRSSRVGVIQYVFIVSTTLYINIISSTFIRTIY